MTRTFRWLYQLKFLGWRRASRRSSQGFTLVELLVTSILISVITALAWTGLLAAMDMSHAAQAKTARQVELNKALDFMTNEIRMAEQINTAGGMTANGPSGSLQAVVQASGLNLQRLGSYGTLALYLERPTRTDHLVKGLCPAGGPNAGQAPPAPKDFDRVVYDIRSSPSGWLPPGTLMRYGRVPNADGSVDPCRNPIASDPIADSLSMVRQTAPSCSGNLFGAGGFFACVQESQVDLFFQSTIPDVGTKDVRTAVSSRLINVGGPGTYTGGQQPPLKLDVFTPESESDGLDGDSNGQMNENNSLASGINLEWTWSGEGTVSEYILRETQGGQAPKELYRGSATAFLYTDVSTNPGCFRVSAQTGTQTVESDEVCPPF